ncbi:hypothetical protein [Cupriavidus sp. D384]|uniref:hypothetical protein n=1 Tax=Cupriavidus sp. D384 TaxID=1538095 RepID=UPI00082B2507|nr:hypothetical protein [Cupriavidus sp. D384]
MNTIRKTTVIVHLAGGTIPFIETDGHVNVVIVDHDVEGVDDADLKTLPDGGKATVRQEAAADVSRQSAQHWLDLAV